MVQHQQELDASVHNLDAWFQNSCIHLSCIEIYMFIQVYVCICRDVVGLGAERGLYWTFEWIYGYQEAPGPRSLAPGLKIFRSDGFIRFIYGLLGR